MEPRLRIYRELCDRGRKEILAYNHRPDTCLFSTALAIDVLSTFGIEAKPLKVSLLCFNKPFWERMSSTNSLPQTERERKAWEEEIGAYALGLGVPDPKKKGPSLHVVCYTEPDHIMIDLSVDQINRPKHGIVVEPAYGHVDEAFLKGQEREYFSTKAGVMLCYEAEPWDNFFFMAPDWADKSRRAKLAKKVETIMRIALRGRI